MNKYYCIVWGKSDKEKCPTCGNNTEVAVIGEYIVAERCQHCKWQVSFSDGVKRVPYGSIPQPVVVGG